MDWMFYLTAFLIMTGVITVMQVARLLVRRHLDKLERKRRLEEEARQVARSNSGL